MREYVCVIVTGYSKHVVIGIGMRIGDRIVSGLLETCGLRVRDEDRIRTEVDFDLELRGYPSGVQGQDNMIGYLSMGFSDEEIHYCLR